MWLLLCAMCDATQGYIEFEYMCVSIKKVYKYKCNMHVRVVTKWILNGVRLAHSIAIQSKREREGERNRTRVIL